MQSLCVLSHSIRVWFFVAPWTVTCQAPLSIEFSRQEYLPYPPLGDLPDPGIKPASPVFPALAGGFFTTELPGKPFYAEYVMQSTRLDETQAEIKIASRNINNLRYADDTTLTAEISGEDPFDEGERVERKVDLKLSIQKTKITASGPITSWQIDGETMETEQTLFLGAPKSLQMVTAAMKLKDSCFLEKKQWQT